MFGKSKHVAFRESAEGVWGEFNTPAGRVMFLTTKARLGGASVDAESRLTKRLCPVREVLDVGKMNFNQLLQRDLDDHRVATHLLPYLLKPKANGPAFFPPILAALLPFKSNLPADHFPERQALGRVEVPEFDGMEFFEWRYGDSFQFQQMAGQGDEPHRVRFGRLNWNDEMAKLVVLDGQHRAMALLAIHRTINQTWQTTGGARYRHFYEHRVQELLESRPDGVPAEIEYPVTLCWFPDETGDSGAPQLAARKLFVDVNENAKKPSKARLVLLSDTELVHVFVRSTLNRLRENAPPFPLYAVEYDNPDEEASRPVRWSVFTNITILRELVLRAVWGPDKYITDMKARFGGRPGWREMDERMRQTLNVEQVVPDSMEDGENRFIPRDALGNERFPIYNEQWQDALVRQFRDGWGEAILIMLGGLLPFKAHIDTISALYRDWTTTDDYASLARDALFEGVGMYWTLRDGNASWEAAKAEARLTRSYRPEIVKAWDAIKTKGTEFTRLRTERYLGTTTPNDISKAERLYKTINTNACQVGLVLTMASIAHHHPEFPLPKLARTLTAALNAALSSSPAKSRNRKLLLGRDAKWPLNLIPSLKPAHAVYYRYFFLELLCSAEATAELDGQVPRATLLSLTADARTNYYEFLVDEKQKALKASDPASYGGRVNATRQTEAEKRVQSELRRSLDKWFKITAEDFDAWLHPDDEEVSGGSGASDFPDSDDDTAQEPTDPEELSLEDFMAAEADED